jgi:hypothetical protein
MKKFLFTMIAVMAVCSLGWLYKAGAVIPPHAASARTWTVGTQTWSDVIHLCGCDTLCFEEHPAGPACWRFTSDTTTCYYYNWPYVHQHAAQLCPSPWRVPTKDDFHALVRNTGDNTLTTLWNYGGYTYNGNRYEEHTNTSYWSSSEYNNGYAFYGYSSGSNSGVSMNYTRKYYGFQVRCVK